jgi:DNA-binding response OmpR family regulator
MPKILIIDDDPDIVEAMKVVLENKNYQVVVARSREEGLKKAKLEKPNLIILDVMMEFMDEGFDVARDLKKDENYKDIPILMLTAVKERTGLDFEKEAGDPDWLPVDDYCAKPLKPDELIAKVEALLRKK